MLAATERYLHISSPRGWKVSSDRFSSKRRSKKRRRGDNHDTLNGKKRLKISPPTSPQVLRPKSRKRKLDLDEPILDDRPAKKQLLELEKKLAELQVQSNSQEEKSNSMALVLVEKKRPSSKIQIQDVSKFPSEMQLSTRTNLALNYRPKLDPKIVSKRVLQTLCSLGCVEKQSLMGQDFYLVLKNKLIPVFPKSTSYYFEHEKGAKATNFHRENDSTITLRTLVGLWLLLVQMGHFVPFPQVRSLHRMFSPEVNDKRLSELGQKWLKQLGVEESMLESEESMLDCLLERLVIALMRGRRAVKDEAERFVEPMEEVF